MPAGSDLGKEGPPGLPHAGDDCTHGAVAEARGLQLIQRVRRPFQPRISFVYFVCDVQGSMWRSEVAIGCPPQSPLPYFLRQLLFLNTELSDSTRTQARVLTQQAVCLLGTFG